MGSPPLGPGFPGLRDLVEDSLDFFENGTVALHCVGRDGTILRANRAELEMMGYAREEYVGRNIADFHADPAVIEDMLERLASGEVLRNRPARLVRRDGRILHVVIDSSVYWKDGEFRHTRCFTRDATEHVSAAAEIRSLSDHLSNAIAELDGVLAVVPVGIGIARDPDCSDIRVNPAFAEQLGITRDTNASKTGDERGTLPFLVLKDGVEVPGDDLPMQRAARERVTIRGEEYDIVHADGRVVRLLEYAAPVTDASGEVRGAVGAFVDITDRRRLDLERERLFASERAARAEAEAARGEAERAREEAESAREAAEAASAAKSDFLAVMSHELRTPLNAIGGYVELLEMGIRGPLTPEQQEDLRRIRRNQTHLIGLINQVLNYARLESHGVPYDLTDVLLADVIATVHPLVEPQLLARGLGFRVEGASADLTVRADAEKLLQILLNLLSNAIKFNDGPGDVTVRCEASGSEVLIHVQDAGWGIARDRLESIFDPFVQIDTRLTRTEEGVGLGLAISRELARGMGGDLTVESAPGRGSTFTVRLPRALGALTGQTETPGGSAGPDPSA